MIGLSIYKGELAPKGGPSGYLYNLKMSIDSNKDKEIDIIYEENTKKEKNIFSFLKRTLKKYVSPNIIYNDLRIENFYKVFWKNNSNTIKHSKILHFHTTQDFFYFCKFNDIKNHILILTSHSPELPYIEKEKKLLSQGYSKSEISSVIERQKEIDIFAFKNANYLIFPCEESVEPYQAFFSYLDINMRKIKYVLTAVPPIEIKTSYHDMKNKLGIDKNVKIIVYIGRKNITKGYDIFCEVAKKFKNNKKYMFISAGIGNIKSPSQNNFIDIGWTDEPGSLLNIADVVLIPNRSTYFDIGVIQALSLGKQIITTLTGGNKWFKNKGFDIHFFEPESVNKVIEYLKDEKIFKNSLQNKTLYNKYFNIDNFANNYKKVYQQCVN